MEIDVNSSLKIKQIVQFISEKEMNGADGAVVLSNPNAQDDDKGDKPVVYIEMSDHGKTTSHKNNSKR